MARTKKRGGLRLSEEEAIALGIIPGPLPPRAPSPSQGSSGPQRSRSPAQEALWCALRAVYGEKVHWEYVAAVPGRNFRIDMALPDKRIAIEVDGWQHHAKTLEGFRTHTHRQNALVGAGWRPLRYLPSDVTHRLDAVLAEIASVVKCAGWRPPATDSTGKLPPPCVETSDDRDS